PAVHDERGNGGTQPAYAGRPDKDQIELPDASAECGIHASLEALLLPAIGIALGRDVDETQRGLVGALHLAGEEDEAGAGAHDGLAPRVEFLEGGHEAPLVEELEQGRALPPGHDET